MLGRPSFYGGASDSDRARWFFFFSLGAAEGTTWQGVWTGQARCRSSNVFWICGNGIPHWNMISIAGVPARLAVFSKFLKVSTCIWLESPPQRDETCLAETWAGWGQEPWPSLRCEVCGLDGLGHQDSAAGLHLYRQGGVPMRAANVWRNLRFRFVPQEIDLNAQLCGDL